MEKPWTAGPRELLEHAVGHLQSGSPFDLRIALISIDNAVELMLKTYLGLPKRVRGTDGPGRKKLGEVEGNFPALLDLFEEISTDTLAGINLGDIEWYHRVRNQLYHQGNGISVDSQHVSAYLEISRILFHNLFDEHFERSRTKSGDEIGKVVRDWARLEETIHEVAGNLGIRDRSTHEAIAGLLQKGLISANDAKEIDNLREVRNRIVHSTQPPKRSALDKMSESTISTILETLVRLV